MQKTKTMGPSQLVALYVATAGLQGDSLGTDEEEIILMIYVIIDVLQNKVLGNQQYVIKPMVMEEENVSNVGNESTPVAGSSGFVSEVALAHAPDLTEQFLRDHGISLQQAIKQFEGWWSSLPYISNGSAPCFIVDGQAPMRQCLHPEACNKMIELPNHYAIFHDLRKEFSSFYSTTDELSPLSIQEMVQYFNLQIEPRTDFYVREVSDMVAVVQRMIKDGHTFGNSETVNLVLEPGICSKDEKVDNNCVVRTRGLPWQLSDQDVARFFRGLNVAKGGVALCLSCQGRRNGEALVRFISKEHRDMALKRHKHHIGQRYIEVYKASGEDFISVAGGANGEAHAFLSRGAQVIVRMRGLPYDCTAKQVIEFFASGANCCQVLDGEEGVLFVKRPDGRSTGDAFVLFPREEDADKALSKHRDSIGARYIELFRSTTAEVQQVLNRVSDAKSFEQSYPLTQLMHHQPAMLSQRFITSGTRKDCIRLRGLPYEAMVEHILEFMGDYAKNIVYQGVHMVYNAQGQPSGEAFIQMDSEASAFACASLRHHRYMVFGKKQRYIEVFQCSGDDMNLVLAGAPLPGKALLSPVGPLAAQAQAANLGPAPANPIAVPAPQHPLWDIHTLVQAQAAQAAQAQAAQAQALRSQDLWLLSLASAAGPHSPTGPTSPNSQSPVNSKTLALPSSVSQHPVPTYSVPTNSDLNHAPMAPPASPLLFFNMPNLPRIPLMRPAPSHHGFISPPHLLHAAPQLNPAAAILGLKRSWESVFPAAEAALPAKRSNWHSASSTGSGTTPFSPGASVPPSGLVYPPQFFPPI